MKPRILLLEDNPVHGSLLREELEDLGYIVEHCVTVDRARSTIHDLSPNLLLLDMVIGDDHLVVTKWLEELREQTRWARTPILVLTAYSVEFADKVTRFPPVRVLGKPVAFEEIRNAIQELWKPE